MSDTEETILIMDNGMVNLDAVREMREVLMEEIDYFRTQRGKVKDNEYEVEVFTAIINEKLDLIQSMEGQVMAQMRKGLNTEFNTEFK